MSETMTRESWLLEAIELLRPRFEAAGLPIPEKIRVSVGFGFGARRESARVIGQCWARSQSDDGVNAVFISPELENTARVLDVLIHELIHAGDDCQNGHKAAFKKVAVAVGLTGQMTATVATPELAADMKELAAKIGEYPHAKLYTEPRIRIQPKEGPGEDGPEEEPGPVSSGPKKQGTRMHKVICLDCGYTVRTTAKWIAVGLPVCPCGIEMTAK